MFLLPTPFLMYAAFHHCQASASKDLINWNVYLLLFNFQGYHGNQFITNCSLISIIDTLSPNQANGNYITSGFSILR